MFGIRSEKSGLLLFRLVINYYDVSEIYVSFVSLQSNQINKIMKFTIFEQRDVEAKYISLCAKVRYFEDGEVNGEEDYNDAPTMPFVKDGSWCPVINIDTGLIENWPAGTTAKAHYYVCDQCSFNILDESDNIVFKQEDDYVPDFLCPEGDGYGDYIIMNISETGKIKNWKPDLSVLYPGEE